MPKKVTKAVIVAAGLGKRMFPFTKIDSKLLVPILNKPIVQYLIQELHDSGIKEVIIVTNHITKLKEFFTKNKHLNKILKKIKRKDIIDYLDWLENLCKIKYIKQDEPRGWLHALLKAKKFIKNEPFVVLFSDCIYTAKIPATKQVIDEFYKKNKNIKSTARFVFKPEIFELSKNIKFPLGDDVSDVRLIDKLKRKKDLCKYKIKGDFFEVGEPISLLRTLLMYTLEDLYYSRKLSNMLWEDEKLKRDFEEFYELMKSESRYIKKCVRN